MSNLIQKCLTFKVALPLVLLLVSFGLITFAVSCGTKRGVQSSSNLMAVGPLLLSVKRGVWTQKGSDLIELAAKTHTDLFEGFWGAPSLYAALEVKKGTYVPCGSANGAVGCYDPRTNIISVQANTYTREGLYLKALLHELFHRNLPGHDPGHLDPRWARIDNEWTEAVMKEIERRRWAAGL